MVPSYKNRFRSGFIIRMLTALLFALPCGVFEQNSPLTVVPSGNKVGINQTNPQSTLDVGENADVRGNASVTGTVKLFGGASSDPLTESRLRLNT
jgi:hypothetical protein